MAFYYVRDHADGTGTATGDGGRFASVQTGDWDTTLSATTQYYASISAALGATTAPTSGDFIVCSSIHDHDYAANTTLTIPDGVTLVSVSDTAIDTYTAGAQETADGAAYDIYTACAAGDKIANYGVTLIGGDDAGIVGSNATNQFSKAEDMTIQAAGASVADGVVSGALIADSNFFDLTNVTVGFPNSSSANSSIKLEDGQRHIWRGVDLVNNANDPLNIFDMAGGGGGGIVDCDGCDFTNMAASGYLVDVTAITADNFLGYFVNCAINSDVTLTNGTPAGPNQRAEAYGCGDATSDQYYSYRIEDHYGTVSEETTIVYTGKALYDGTNELSLSVNTNSNCIEGSLGLRFKLLGQYADLTTSKTVTVYLIINNTSGAASALDVTDVQMLVKRPDTTNKALGVFNRAQTIEPLKSSPTALTTDGSGASSWEGETGGSNTNYYKISYAIGALTGITNGLVEVEMEIMKSDLGANETIYINPEFDLA